MLSSDAKRVGQTGRKLGKDEGSVEVCSLPDPRGALELE